MNERSVNSITSVKGPETGIQNKAIVPGKTETTLVRENRSTGLERGKGRSDMEAEQMKSLSNISIHFNVDDETNRLIVVVTERSSGRVIRTIPASEFEKLHAGDLLKLTA